MGSPIGNLMLQSVLRGRRPPAVQCASRISMPGDPWEQEAEWVADAVVSGPPAATGCTCGTGTPCTACGEEPPISRTAAHAGTPVASPSSDARPAGPGQPLDRASRSFFEYRFGRDFSGVRVHTGHAAAASAGAHAAEAYTTSRDIVFAQGRYAPETLAGRHLLAHELTHVVQQEGGSHLVASSAGRRDVIHRQADADVATPPGTKDIVEQIAETASRPTGASRGTGDFPAAFRILNRLAMFDLLPTLRRLRTRGLVTLLWDHLYQAVDVNVDRLRTAFLAEQLSRSDAAEPAIQALVELATGTKLLPADQVADIQHFMGAYQFPEQVRLAVRHLVKTQGLDGAASPGAADVTAPIPDDPGQFAAAALKALPTGTPGERRLQPDSRHAPAPRLRSISRFVRARSP